jgi:hypothetical protein
MSGAETPVPFRASLPAYAHGWIWLPLSTVTLTLLLPHGQSTVFHSWYCPQQRQLAHNVAALTPGGAYAP